MKFYKIWAFFISQTWTRTWNEEFNFDSLRLLILKFFTIHICVCWFDSRAKKFPCEGLDDKVFQSFRDNKYWNAKTPLERGRRTSICDWSNQNPILKRKSCFQIYTSALSLIQWKLFLLIENFVSNRNRYPENKKSLKWFACYKVDRFFSSVLW